eukprot:scaffold321742_cov31-Tisochrysis_lutea.AAC.1
MSVLTIISCTSEGTSSSSIARLSTSGNELASSEVDGILPHPRGVSTPLSVSRSSFSRREVPFPRVTGQATRAFRVPLGLLSVVGTQFVRCDGFLSMAMVMM